ncbi:MAG TPA: hypothetical protein VIK33_18650, partial [Anaerolineae bacterium]
SRKAGSIRLKRQAACFSRLRFFSPVIHGSTAPHVSPGAARELPNALKVYKLGINPCVDVPQRVSRGEAMSL